MRIFLIRHGDKEISNDSMHKKLSPLGERQAARLGRHLAGEHIERVYASDMARARQTAQIANALWEAPLEERACLREIDRGALRGRTRAEVYAAYPDFAREDRTHKTDYPYPGGECGQDVWNRSRIVLDDIRAQNIDTTAIISHAGTMLCLLCGMLELPFHRRFFLGYPPMYCGVTEIRVMDGRYVLHRFNEYGFLEGLIPSAFAESTPQTSSLN